MSDQRKPSSTVGELWRRGQHGWPASYPVAQFPNPPLFVALAGWLLGAVGSGTLHGIGRGLFVVGIAVWAWQEAFEGVNLFRRVVGVGALVWLVAKLAGEL